MKFTVVRESFYSVLQKAGYFISSKIGEINLLKGALIEAKKNGIFVKTTNVGEYFIGEIGGKVDREGVALVDFKTLFEVVSATKDTKINVEKEKNSLLLIGRAGVVKLPVLEHSNFPQPPQTKKTTEINSRIFSNNILASVIFSCATDETRPILTGVCFDFLEEKINIVGTDGFRMSLVSLEKENFGGSVFENKKIVVSAKSLVSVGKIYKNTSIKVFFSQEDKTLRFVGDGTTVFTRLLDGEYPPYEKVIPSKTETQIRFSKEDFLNSLKTTALFARGESNMVVLFVKDGGVKLSSLSSSAGEATLEVLGAKVEGKNNKLAFNYRFLLDLMNNINEEEVVLELTNPLSPGLFRGLNKDGYIHIIMPIRTQ